MFILETACLLACSLALHSLHAIDVNSASFTTNKQQITESLQLVISTTSIKIMDPIHLPENYLPEITFLRKTLDRNYINPNVHFPERALGRNYISLNVHLA